jgi:hypothetical protein
MQLADIQLGLFSRENLIESVYMLIKNDYGGLASEVTNILSKLW